MGWQVGKKSFTSEGIKGNWRQECQQEEVQSPHSGKRKWIRMLILTEERKLRGDAWCPKESVINHRENASPTEKGY